MQLKSVLIDTAGRLGGYQLARVFTARQPKILMYHRFSAGSTPGAVSSEGFERQLITIKRLFNPMTLSGLAATIRADGVPPKHTVVITVDDGYKDFYEVAYPLLKKHQVPATFFVTTGFVNQDLWLWPDQVRWLLENCAGNERAFKVGSQEISLQGPVDDIWQTIIDVFLSVPNDDRLRGLADLQKECGLELPHQAPEIYSASRWDQLEEMQKHGIEIGGHTMSHPSLGRMSTDDTQREVESCSNMLTENLGRRPRSFCYPNGTPADYSNDVKRVVETAGFTAAVTAFSDKYNLQKPFAWRRFVGTEETFQFQKSLFGVEHIGNVFRKTIRSNY